MNNSLGGPAPAVPLSNRGSGARGFRAALLIGWATLPVAGWLYARDKGIPVPAALPVLAAFLLEYPFYLLAGFASVRARLGGRYLSLLLVASALVPYIVYSLGTGQFRWAALTQLAALASAVTLWYVVLPPGWTVDLAFLVFLAAVMLRKYFGPIYTSPVLGLNLEILGHLALIHLSAIVLLVERGVTGTGFGFVPNRQEWKIGVRHFLYFLPIGLLLGLTMKLIHFGLVLPPVKVIATFFAMLWVVALSEEFYFRGLLQQWLGEWSGNPRLALAAASIIFGLCHLGVRAFPNWKFALLAAVAGGFYGRAYQQAHSIRAGMVTHALVVTTWRALFP